MGQPICVFCSSSDAVSAVYVEAAAALGRLIAAGGHELVYGGMAVGLMGAVARAVHDGGGRVVGIVPQGLDDDEQVYHDADEIIQTPDIRQRKAVMQQMAEAFVVLPGGFGTLEELAETLALGTLKMHDKPIVIINTAGFYDSLLSMFERFFGEGFAKQRHRRRYEVVADAGQAMAYLESRFAGHG
jgi:uncharacterized protein (TIGR00730 family)